MSLLPPPSPRSKTAAARFLSPAAVAFVSVLLAPATGCAGEAAKPAPSKAAKPAAVPAARPAAPAAAAAPAAPHAMPPGAVPMPQPDGPAPAGMTWSAEHGHWHDATGAAPISMDAPPMTMNAGSGAAPLTLTPVAPGGAAIPQPDGPVPPGKEWSAEHGHWHDIPGAAPAGQPGQPIQLTPGGTPGAIVPQPDGPVPPGKVWSPEHGHWHDVPGAGQAGQPMQLMPTDGSAPVTLTPSPMPAGGAIVPQPDGPVPPGKVWSPEHGHWHDVPGAMPVPMPVPVPTPAPAPAPAPAPKKP